MNERDTHSSPAIRRVPALLAWRPLPWLVVALGIVLRLVRYVDDRSLWLDESFMSLNLIEKSFRGILGVLDYTQSAPPGFLLVEKAAVALLGDDELALRLFPLFCGISALVLFKPAAERLLSPAGALLALTLFAVNEPLVHYSTEVKPYSADILAAVALLLLYVRLRAHDELTFKNLAPLAVAGAVAVWFSYPSVFVLAGLGLGLLGRALGANRRSILAAASVGALWVASFALVYSTSATIGVVEKAIFEPVEIVPQEGRSTLVRSLFAAWGSVVDPGGFPKPSNWLAAAVLVVGLVVTARLTPIRALAFATPGVLAFVAALLGKYPVGARFWQFLVPLGLIFFVAGVLALVRFSLWRTPTAVALAVLLLAAPVFEASRHAVDPPRPENIKPLLGYLKANWRAGDTLYVYSNSQYALRYYAECRDCDNGGPFPWPLRPAPKEPGQPADQALESVPPSVIVGGDLKVLRGRERVWLLFSHINSHGVQKDDELVLEQVDRFGRRLDKRRAQGAKLYLYRLEAGSH